LAKALEQDAHLTAEGYEWSLRGAVYAAQRVKLGQTTLPDLCVMSPLNRTVATSLNAQQGLLLDGHQPRLNLALSQAREVAHSVGSSTEEKTLDFPWESGKSLPGEDFEWDRIGSRNYNTGLSHGVEWFEPLDERPNHLLDTVAYLASGIHKRTGRGRSCRELLYVPYY